MREIPELTIDTMKRMEDMTWKEFGIDYYLEDGDTIDCGDKSIKVFGTPGHTKGCMSFIFPVFDNEERHVAALFGGATPPWNNDKGKTDQRDSVIRFTDITKQEHTDVVLTNHTAFDNGLIRIEYSRSRMSYMPNIYVLGEKGVGRFLTVYKKLAEGK